MIKRPTWIMVIVLALLAGLTYYMQTVPDNFIKKAMDAGKTPTPGTSTTSLLSSTDGAISGLEIKTGDGQYSAVIKRDQTGWTISNNAQTPSPADQSVVEQAQRLQLTGPQIKPNTADLSGFGLDKPVYIYKVTLDGGKILTFKIGRPTIMEDGYYLQKEDGTIAVVDKYGMDALIALLKQPSPISVTPSPDPANEVPTGTITPTPAATATPGN